MTKNMPKMISFYPQGDRDPEGRSNRVDLIVDEENRMVRYAGHRSPLTAEQRKDLYRKIYSGGTLYELDSHRRLITVDRDEVMSLLKKDQ